MKMKSQEPLQQMAPEAASTKNDEYQEVSDFLINLKLGKYK
jgi:hypothetical protein